MKIPQELLNEENLSQSEFEKTYNHFLENEKEKTIFYFENYEKFKEFLSWDDFMYKSNKINFKEAFSAYVKEKDFLSSYVYFPEFSFYDLSIFENISTIIENFKLFQKFSQYDFDYFIEDNFWTYVSKAKIELWEKHSKILIKNQWTFVDFLMNSSISKYWDFISENQKLCFKNPFILKLLKSSFNFDWFMIIFPIYQKFKNTFEKYKIDFDKNFYDSLDPEQIEQKILFFLKNENFFIENQINLYLYLSKIFWVWYNYHSFEIRNKYSQIEFLQHYLEFYSKNKELFINNYLSFLNIWDFPLIQWKRAIDFYALESKYSEITFKEFIEKFKLLNKTLVMEEKTL